MKKVTLLELVATKIIYAVLLALYYWMFARRDWHDYYSTIQNVVAIITIFFFVYQYVRIKKYKQEITDELATQNLKRTDSICIKIFSVAVIITAFMGAIEIINNLQMGYEVLTVILKNNRLPLLPAQLPSTNMLSI